MSEFAPSQKQIDIFDVWQNENSNIVISACAGSGKTTVLMQLLEYCNERTLFLAFNKSIQEEIQNKIESRNLTQGKAMTMHSLGLLAVRNHYSSLLINKNKNLDLIKKLQNKHKAIFKYLRWKDKLSLSYTLMDINDASRLYLTDDLKIIKKNLLSSGKLVSDHQNLNALWKSFIEIRNDSYRGSKVVIDFIDMIYVPVLKSLNVPLSPSYLFVDECQDLSELQHKFLNLFIAQGDVKKWIAVGDRNQAIYNFAGGSSNSFELFLEKDNVKELPLDICYRCPKKVIDSANEVYDVMEYSIQEEGLVEDVYEIGNIKLKSLVICRNSGPLVDLYFKLLGIGQPAFIKGDDILNSITKFLKPYNSYTTTGAKVEMNYKIKELESKNTEESRIALHIFKENYNNYLLLVKNLCDGYSSIGDLLIKVKKLFIREDNAVILCTIHKAKGLEADSVYILNENLIPSKFAKSPEQLIQENNLKYVARSRAKKELYFLKL